MSPDPASSDVASQAHTAAAVAAADGGLPRRFGAWTAALAVVGIIVGSGIFRAPPIVAGLVGEPLAILAVWVAGGLLALGLGLLLAELGSAMPRAGGQYVFLREAFGGATAFVFGWTFLLVNPAAWAALAVTAAEFLAYVVPLDGTGQRIVAVTLIVALALANCRSAVLGAGIQSLATVAKVLALVALVAFVVSDPHGGGALAAPGKSAAGMGAWLMALVVVLWAYDGAGSFCSLAGEIRNPARNLPRAIVGGLLVVMAIFVAVNGALLYALPLDVLAASPLPLSTAVEARFGSAAVAVVALAVVIATTGSLSACTLSDPRVLYAMARDGNFFRGVARVDRRHLTPVVAIGLHALVACLYVSVRTLEQLAATFVLGLVPFYALVAVAAWRLRPRTSPPFRAPAVALLAACWVVTALLLIANALIETPSIAGLNLAITAAGIPVYLAWRRFRAAAAPP
ncbi:MAG: amino acid permease [Sinobacteraceae bacterium]|nr:amino acid permease [Nevskiaceae bacterium]